MPAPIVAASATIMLSIIWVVELSRASSNDVVASGRGGAWNCCFFGGGWTFLLLSIRTLNKAIPATPSTRQWCTRAITVGDPAQAVHDGHVPQRPVAIHNLAHHLPRQGLCLRIAAAFQRDPACRADIEFWIVLPGGVAR